MLLRTSVSMGIFPGVEMNAVGLVREGAYATKTGKGKRFRKVRRTGRERRDPTNARAQVLQKACAGGRGIQDLNGGIRASAVPPERDQISFRRHKGLILASSSRAVFFVFCVRCTSADRKGTSFASVAEHG